MLEPGILSPKPSREKGRKYEGEGRERKDFKHSHISLSTVGSRPTSENASAGTVLLLRIINERIVLCVAWSMEVSEGVFDIIPATGIKVMLLDCKRVIAI